MAPRSVSTATDRLRAAVRTLRGSWGSDPVERRGHRHFLASTVAHRLGGFRLYNKDLCWWSDQDFLETWQAFPEGDALVKDRRFVLWSMARSTANLDGDTAECGVYNGASSWLICATGDPHRSWFHHAFDSFEGLSEPQPADVPTDPSARRWVKHDFAVGIDRVKRNLEPFADRVRLHAGWIPDRFADLDDRSRFRFVHLDVDLYQPTLDSLAWFYPRMVPGGIILCDDYAFTTCPGARRAFDEFLAERSEGPVVELPTGQGFVVRRGPA